MANYHNFGKIPERSFEECRQVGIDPNEPVSFKNELDFLPESKAIKMKHLQETLKMYNLDVLIISSQ